MGAIQQSINSAIGSVGVAGTIGKHFKETEATRKSQEAAAAEAKATKQSQEFAENYARESEIEHLPENEQAVFSGAMESMVDAAINQGVEPSLAPNAYYEAAMQELSRYQSGGYDEKKATLANAQAQAQAQAKQTQAAQLRARFGTLRNTVLPNPGGKK